jgi:hypothetical protein
MICQAAIISQSEVVFSTGKHVGIFGRGRKGKRKMNRKEWDGMFI